MQVASAQKTTNHCTVLLPHDSGALSKMTFSGDAKKSKPVTVEVNMTELDCSGAVLQASGATILAAWIQHK